MTRTRTATFAESLLGVTPDHRQFAKIVWRGSRLTGPLSVSYLYVRRGAILEADGWPLVIRRRGWLRGTIHNTDRNRRWFGPDITTSKAGGDDHGE